MKTPNRKKLYAWKALWKRRRQALRHYDGHKTGLHNAPKDYCKPFWAKHRAKEKEAIARIKKGYEDADFPFNHQYSATWDYW